MKARRIESILCKQDHFGFDGDTYALRLEDGTTVQMTQEFMEDYRPRVGGYLIHDDNQVISYSASKPKEASAQCDFGVALAALKAGKAVSRAGWNGKGMFVYLVPANAYPAQTGVAKQFFGENALVPYNAYLAIKNVDGTVSTWVPSVNDVLSDDWMVL